nr:hypothetical protein GCM10020092_076800 [Actinoplanes digitatis]
MSLARSPVSARMSATNDRSAIATRSSSLSQGDVDEIGEQLAFVAEHRVHGLHGDAGLGGDGGQRRRGVTRVHEQFGGRVEDRSPGLSGLFLTPG